MPDSTSTQAPHPVVGVTDHGAEVRDDADVGEERPRTGAPTWYDVLEVPRHASAAELTSACERALALVEGRSVGGFLMLDPVAADSVRADVETARHILCDPSRRDAYDRWLARRVGRLEGRSEARAEGRADARPDGRTDGKVDASDARSEVKTGVLRIVSAEEGRSGPSAASIDERDASARAAVEVHAASGGALDAVFPRTHTPTALRFLPPTPLEERGPMHADAPRGHVDPPVNGAQPHGSLLPSTSIPQPSVVEAGPITSIIGPATALPDGEIDGDVIRGLREARGLSLDQVAESTKIRKPYLKAIEENDVANLPDRVYLRGFLTQVARVLKVDRVRLSEGYLHFVNRQPSTKSE